MNAAWLQIPTNNTLILYVYDRNFIYEHEYNFQLS